MPLPILRTPRLMLRPWTMDDVDALHALWTQPEVRRYLWDDVVISREQAEPAVRRTVAAADRDGVGCWMLIDNHSGSTVGFAGLFSIVAERGPELLFGLAPESWGHGFATEGAGAVLAYAFVELAFERVLGAVDPPNTASARVMERLGMRSTHRGVLKGQETVFYELRRDDFTAAAAPGTAPR